MSDENDAMAHTVYVDWDNSGGARAICDTLGDGSWYTADGRKWSSRDPMRGPSLRAERHRVCTYCGSRYQDNGKPNCSQCGAPKRGG